MYRAVSIVRPQLRLVGPIGLRAESMTLLVLKAQFSTDPVAPKKAPLGTRIWKRVKEEAHHYWMGTKLLGSNMKVSSNLLLRLARGEILTRREKQLLELTVADSIRLVPFIVIAIVPFLEFSLPFLLKIFPNMLPSTYTTKDQQKNNLNASLKVRLEMAKFLQSATSRLLEEEIKKELTEESASEILARASKGQPVSNAEIIKIGRVLKNELALENIAHQELQAVAKFFGVNRYGPRTYLQYNLERKLKKLREDDVMIAAEGIENLTIEELTQANFIRGMKVEGRTRDEMEKQLEDWMELADSDEVPPFLLLLSRSFTTSASDTAVAKEAIERLVKSNRVEEILSTLPDDSQVYEQKLKSMEAEDLSASFKSIDSDNDGKISLDELKELMYRLEESYSMEEVEQLLKRVDSNNDGFIDFKEFIKVLKSKEEQAGIGQAFERELLLMRKDISTTKKEMQHLDELEASAPPVPGAHLMADKIGSMIKELEKELGNTALVQHHQQQGAGPKSKMVKLDGDLWAREELWGGSDQDGKTVEKKK